MTTCILVAALIRCTIAPGTVPTPQQAAAILAPHETVIVTPAPEDYWPRQRLTPSTSNWGSPQITPYVSQIPNTWSATTYLPWGGYSGAYSGLGGYVFHTRVDGATRGEHSRRRPQ